MAARDGRPTRMSEATTESWGDSQSRSPSKQEILERVTEVLVDAFEIDPADVRPDAHFVDDLDLDSIDAIDLAVGLRERTGLELSEAELKSIRVVQDVVDLLCRKLPDA
jgi:acyl carrier protein